MIKMKVTINFDLDGTLADLYGVEDWLPMLRAYDATPYREAKPLLRLCHLARTLNRLQREGYKLAVISWLSKESCAEYDKEVILAKLEWLAKHLPSVNWDRISIVAHGTPKEEFCETPFDILFDDEEKNRNNWGGIAFGVNDILETLKIL
jgi:hypothetical protein